MCGCFSFSAFKGFMTGMYVLTFGAIPLLLAVLLFAYCSKHSSSDWNKTNRKKLPYVSKRFPFIQHLRHLIIDDGDGNRNACTTTTTTTRSLPSINTVSSLVYKNEIYSDPTEDSNSYRNTSEPIYATILENDYINKACCVPQPKYEKSRISKSDIFITNLTSTTNPQVKNYLQDGVWGDSK